MKKVRSGISIWRKQGFGGLKSALARKVLSNQGSTAMWQAYKAEAAALAEHFDFSSEDLISSYKVQSGHAGELKIQSVTWFIPDFQHAYYGGMHTILRFADFMTREYGVTNQFALVGTFDTEELSAKISEAFPALQAAKVCKVDIISSMNELAPMDASIATLWSTAYASLKFNDVKRKFYFIQDYEPLFYPAGSTQAQVEATYKFGFYGLCNTPPLRQIYQEQYKGQATSFNPCVDSKVFNTINREVHHHGAPWRVFFYARPEHPRNGFELCAVGLRKLKHRLGDQVQILSAGDSWDPKAYGLQGVVDNLGLIPYEKTGDVYRSCDAGLVMMFTRHPSYLPFEMMACGCGVVSNRNPWTEWFLRDGQNCYLADSSATSIADTLEEALINESLRATITTRASQEITQHYSDWHAEFKKVFAWMSSNKSD
ncbi:MAG: glycosyltransferase [Anaerolineaceae bacterium]|nr:glycosyltransferase [Anaerolineaceae bacterium]